MHSCAPRFSTTKVVMWFLTALRLTSSHLTLNFLQIGILWIVFALFGGVPSPLESTSFTTDPEVESQFVNLYGNDSEESGLWKRMHDIRYDINKLKNISTQVHTKVFNRSEHVTTALVIRRLLLFRNHPEYGESMTIDVVRYTIHQFLLRPEDKVLLFHFTKGLGPDSVHYLEANDTNEDRKVVYLSHLVPGIDLYPNC